MINRDMPVFCFETLNATLSGRVTPKAPLSIPVDAKYPLFVTWKIGPRKELRGCIGTFSSLPLASGLAEYALTAALRDTRFNPITLSELPSLHCGVSLLVKFELADNYLDWEVGVHGIRIHFIDPLSDRQRDGVFLPEVAIEQGWDNKKTLDQLLRKAGYRGEVDERLRLSVQVTRFQSEKLTLSYAEWTNGHHHH